MLLLQSCGTTRVEYIREYPELDWPEFPVIKGQFIQDGNYALLTLDEFISLAEFKIDYEALKSFYTELEEDEK